MTTDDIPARDPDEADAVRVQAMLDGELSRPEADALRREMALSPRLRAIHMELVEMLADLSCLMSDNDEPVVVLPFRARVRSAFDVEWQRAAIFLVTAGALLFTGNRVGAWMAGGPSSTGTANVVAVERQIATPDLATPPARRRVAQRARPLPADDLASEPAPQGLRIDARGLSLVAARDRDAVSGSRTYRLGSNEVTLDFGGAGVGFGGQRVDGPLADASASDGSAPPRPAGLPALVTGQSARAPADSMCQRGIEWSDASGTTLRLRGPYTCRQLRQIASRFVVRIPESSTP